MALIVSHGCDQESEEVQLVFGCGGIKAVPSSVVTLLPVRSGLDWCHPFLCWGMIEIDGVEYPVTVLRDSSTAVTVKECDWEVSCL